MALKMNKDEEHVTANGCLQVKYVTLIFCRKDQSELVNL